jgi:heme/copper-type cytochrome/quinol oxidase subunit 3
VNESAEVDARVATVGGYLAAAACAFFFLAFFFAFLYLRALNTNDLWAAGRRHHHVHAALTVGIVVLVCVLASVALARFALVDRRAGWAALVLGLVAVAVQCWQYTDLGFGPGDGGYASVYLGWTGFFTIFVFFAMVWLEMLLVGGRRTAADLGAFTRVWTTLGIVEIAAFVLLFVVT